MIEKWDHPFQQGQQLSTNVFILLYKNLPLHNRKNGD